MRNKENFPVRRHSLSSLERSLLHRIGLAENVDANLIFASQLTHLCAIVDDLIYPLARECFVWLINVEKLSTVLKQRRPELTIIIIEVLGYALRCFTKNGR